MFAAVLLLAFTLAGSHLNVASMALEKRRFGQESPPVLQDIHDLGKKCNDNSGLFDNIAGGFISELLAAKDPCGRYEPIDRIITLTRQKNCLQQGVEVARKLAALEKNFNPFAGENGKPQFCNNAALPASEEVRCIVPAIDPGFGNAQQFNQAAKSRLAQVQANAAGNPGLCAGQSVQQQAIALGISDCANCKIGSNNATGGVVVKNAAKTENAVSQNGGGNQTTRQNDVDSNTTAGNNSTVVRCENPGNNGAGNNGAQGNGGTTKNNETTSGGTTNVTSVKGKNKATSSTQAKGKNGGNTGKSGNGTSTDDGSAGNGISTDNGSSGNGTSTDNGSSGNGTSNDGGNNGSSGDAGKSGVHNVNLFTGALLGAPPVVVNDLGEKTLRRFQVLKPDGSLDGDFLNKNGALVRACVNQKNACTAIANGSGGTKNGTSVSDCEKQDAECKQANGV